LALGGEKGGARHTGVGLGVVVEAVEEDKEGWARVGLSGGGDGDWWGLGGGHCIVEMVMCWISLL
jgi:hypothetical protein